MIQSNAPLSSRERVSGLLAYIFFLMPHITKVKTDFTMFHAKQSLILLVMIIVTLLVPYIGWVFRIVIIVVSLWCMYMAYRGEKFVIPYVGDNMDTLYNALGMAKFFSTK